MVGSEKGPTDAGFPPVDKCSGIQGNLCIVLLHEVEAGRGVRTFILDFEHRPLYPHPTLFSIC